MMEILLIAQPVEPTQTFYAIVAGTLAVLIAGMFGYMTRKLIGKIEDIAVAQTDHSIRLEVHDEKHKAIEKQVDTHQAKFDRFERVFSAKEFAKEIAEQLKTAS